MTIIELTYNQSRDLLYYGKEIKKRHKGVIYYIQNFGEFGLSIRTWCGEAKDTFVVFDEVWQDEAIELFENTIDKNFLIKTSQGLKKA